jgi:hypothetical protein
MASAKNRLSEQERERILAVANSAEFGQLPPSQIAPRLADHGCYIASESSFYRALRAANQVKHRSAARPARALLPSLRRSGRHCAGRPQRRLSAAIH